MPINKVNVFIDFGTKEGMGHLSRIRSILDAISDLFTLDVKIFSNNPIVNEAKLKDREVNAVFNSWLNLVEIDEIELKNSLVIIDSYRLQKGDIDFLINKSLYNLIIIDQYGNNLNELGNYLLPSITKTLNYNNVYEGPKYTLIKRDIFELGNLTRNLQSYSSSNNTIFITIGSYPNQSKLIEIISYLLDNTSFNIAVLTKIKLSIFENARIILLNAINELVNIVHDLNFAICSAGVTANEIIFLGIPQIIINTAENQNVQFSIFESLEIITLQLNSNDFFSKLETTILSLSNTRFYDEYLLKTKKRSQLIDGHGAKRLVSKLLDLNDDLSLIPVNLNHLDFLYNLRNDEVVRANSIDSSIVNYQGHKSWLENKISDRNTILRLISFNGVNAGQLRIDVSGTSGKVSISLIEKYRGYGLANLALNRIIDLIRQENLLTTLLAQIKSNNLGSVKLFESCGFKLRNTVDGIGEYELKV